MKLTVEIFDGKYPSFNLNLHSKEGAEPFLTLKGLRMVEGNKGRFVSMPAKKLDSGKYYNHAWASDAFQDAIKAAWDAARPKPEPKREEQGAIADMADDVPW